MKRLVTLTLALAAFLANLGAALADGGALGDIGKPRAEGDTPHFLPTLSLALGYDGVQKADAYGSFVLGVSHYPLSQPWSPFYSVAAELDLRTVVREDGEKKTAVVFGPQIRGGISFFPDNNGWLSLMNAYGFVGYRAPSAVDSGAFRCGVGISSLGLGLALASGGLILPWMLEGALDVAATDLRIGGRVGVSY